MQLKTVSDLRAVCSVAFLLGMLGCRSSTVPFRGVIQRPAAMSLSVPQPTELAQQSGNESATTVQKVAQVEANQSESGSRKTNILPVSATAEVVQLSPNSSGERPLFEIPSELPGSNAPPLRVPSSVPNETDDVRASKIEKLYRPLTPVRPGAPTDERIEWSLAALQAFAFDHSPAVQQAVAQAEAARGAMIQAGLAPNPVVGYEADTVRTLATNGYQGVFFTQQIITGGKLDLQQSAAAMAYQNACLAIQKAKADVATLVRDAYFDYLVAQERLRLQRSMARFTDNIYKAQIEQVKADQAAAYEPLQLRVFGSQARNAVISAENAERSAWRRLSAALGEPEMTQLQIGGEVARAVPELNFDAARNYLLQSHTDLHSARNSITQARFSAQLESIRPRRPDVNLYGAIQHDYTGAPFSTTYNLQVGVPLPIFDRNQGNILQTQSKVLSSDRALADATNILSSNLADAFSRFHTARQQSASYRDDILPDQVRVYRGVYARYQQDRQAVNFGDIVVAQQSLVTAVSSYTDALTDQWQAYVDIAGLLQLEDLSHLDQIAAVPVEPPAPTP